MHISIYRIKNIYPVKFGHMNMFYSCAYGKTMHFDILWKKLRPHIYSEEKV